LTDEGISQLNLKELLSFKWSSKFTSEECLPEIAKRTNLTSLGLDQRLRTDAGLAHLTSLVNLKQFTFQNNTDQLIESFRPNVTKLINLNIFRCPLIVDGLNLFRYISDLTFLQTLSIHHVPNIKPECWALIRRLTGLRSLKIGNVGIINTEVLQNILQLTQLRILEFSEPQIDDTALDLLPNLKELTTLSITEKETHSINPRHLQAIGKLKNLVHLTLKGCIKLGGFHQLSKSKKLSYLNASGSGMTDTEATTLSLISSLNVLILENNNITNNSIQSFSALKNLNELNVSGCTSVSYTFQSISQVLDQKGLLFLHDSC